MSDAATSVKEVTFESGYDRLKSIVGRLDEDNVSVDEMCRLFAEGKGLEKELRAYLEEQQGRLDEIEGGQNLPEFRIVAPSDDEDAEPDTELDWPDEDGQSDTADFQSAPPSRSSTDDDIPF